MKTVIHRAETRGQADHGWLKAKHSFSFAHYFNPTRMNFGALRVFNDDLIAPSMGFGTHPHDNMEIVSIILNGRIRHKDSMGNVAEITKDEIQVMSAGTGITHSEFNADTKETLNLLQLWVMPKEYDIKPRYDQVKLNPEDRKDKIQTIVAPDVEGAMWINQDAYFSRASLSTGKSIDYKMFKEGNGVYVFVIEGTISTNDTDLKKRDAIGVWESDKVNISATADAELLFVEVPMNY